LKAHIGNSDQQANIVAMTYDFNWEGRRREILTYGQADVNMEEGRD